MNRVDYISGKYNRPKMSIHKNEKWKDPNGNIWIIAGHHGISKRRVVYGTGLVGGWKEMDDVIIMKNWIRVE